LSAFEAQLKEQVKKMIPVHLLHEGIANAFEQHRSKVLQTPAVSVLALSDQEAALQQGQPTVARVQAELWLQQPHLHEEVFGPYTLLIACANLEEMMAVAAALEGQLTTTIMANEHDLQQCQSLIDRVKEKCGRLILNGVPTGVEVCKAMQHGGPFPATTDPRFGAVGEDALKRFARPFCYQNWPDPWLPDELKDENPLQIFRTVNGQLTR
jgi:NADP-dependent aldehyde dehydrogenase